MTVEAEAMSMEPQQATGGMSPITPGRSPDEQMQTSPTSTCPVLPSQRTSFSVEGNIGVGKSTFLDVIKNDETLNRLVEIFEEPVASWQNVQGDPKNNMLSAFYSDTKRYAYTFQNYVFVTRFLQHHRAAMQPKAPISLLERSVFTDCCVFAKTVHEEGLMSDLEHAVYTSWFEPVLETLPHLVPDNFIYLRAKAETCHERLCSRNRSEEAGVGVEYLKIIHEKHEAWFVHGSCPAEITGGGKQAVPCGKVGDPLDNSSAVNVRILDGKYSHHYLHGKTVLVIDCDPNLSEHERGVLAMQLKTHLQRMGCMQK